MLKNRPQHWLILRFFNFKPFLAWNFVYNYDKVGDLVSFTEEGGQGFKAPSIRFFVAFIKFLLGRLKPREKFAPSSKKRGILRFDRLTGNGGMNEKW